jgi:hypothetical protein
MALTKAREIALFEALDVPYSPSVQRMVEDGTMSVQKIVPTAIACFYTITTYLTNSVYTDATLQAVLESYLDKWIALGTRVDSLENGNIGSLQNVNYSVKAERALLSDRISNIVPYRRYQDSINRGHDAMVPIAR